VDSQVNHILLHPTPKMKKDALHRHDNLKDLSAVYILEMERINRLEPTQKKIALDTLSLVADATRPLNLSGLQLALAFEGGDSKVDDDALVDPVTVNNLCGGLVVFDETLAIRLLNFSVEKYLESLNMTAASAHCKLASACLNYLSLGVVQSGACSSEGDVQISHLFDYAARNWGHHWRLSGETDPLLLPKALSLLTSNKSFDPMSRVFFSPTGTTHHGQDHGGQRPLQFLSRCGLLITINALAQWYNNQYYNEQNRYRGRQYSGQSYNTQSYSVHISVKDSGGRTPVSWAAENAQDGAVQQLATSGADIISGDNSGINSFVADS
jgi:hypothetical protein